MSKIIYDALRSPYLKQILSDVKMVADQLSVDFFGVGAFARNVWYVANDEPSRGTKDVDFGVYVSNEKIYSRMRGLLIEKHGYEAASNNAFCLISPYGIPLDLLPFGEIERDGRVLIEGKGIVSISLDGFRETYKSALVETEIEGDTVKVCSIPAVVLLKLIAYDDRPENRSKDPMDISSIFSHYPSIETDLIWDEYNFLYDQELKHEEIGVMVLGYEVGKIIKANQHLSGRVLTILDKAIKLESKLAERMILDPMKSTITDQVRLLSLLRVGIVKELVD
ncbi:hypothetical protein [Neolewinella persica]|uniref:hypothetical protein n=1 Tax=Neolewinella persica TaxID=70998 RepID=UPI000368F782|nr:hypothetical protein [Neolewinella persica]